MFHEGDMLKSLLHYYSYDKSGVETIDIHYYNLEWCKEHPYCILSNEGVSMMDFTPEELAEATRICIEEGIVIDPITIRSK